jgi:hypothetical protein
MNSTWITQSQLRLWLIRRSKGRDSLAYREAMGDFRHALHQTSRDYKPRGASINRRGANNRRFRRWKATQPTIVFSCTAFDLVA